MIHYSKKDWWLVGAAVAASVIPLTLAAFFLIAGDANRGAAFPLFVIGAVTGAVVMLLTYPLHYQITSSELIVRCGMLMHRHILLASIDEIEPDRNPAGSPAWSLDRLRVDYREKGEPTCILISPEDKFAFMQELARTDVELKMKDDRLIRESR